MGYPVFVFLLLCATDFCSPVAGSEENLKHIVPHTPEVSLIVLGSVQDGGSPHPGCKRACCSDLFLQPDQTRMVASLGIIDHRHQKTYLIDATPDFPEQIRFLLLEAGFSQSIPDGIFLTHAHIGHYTGLMYLGKEALNSVGVPVFVMARMKDFLTKNGPWSQLVTARNIALQEIQTDVTVQQTPLLRITPFIVPHRDEFSETVGYRIAGPAKSAMYIPDIDKWEKWDRSVIDEIAKVDYAFIDGTFYDGAEISYRDIAGIPHPFIVESMALFENLPVQEKQKIFFIHFNHTNPVLDLESIQAKEVLAGGFRVAGIGQVFGL